VNSIVRPVVRSPARSPVRGVVRNAAGNPLSIFRSRLFSTDIIRGVPPYAPAVVGDVDGNRLTLNNEDFWEAVLAEEMRQYGLLRTFNAIAFAEDITQSAWTTANGANADTATSVSFDGTANGELRQLAVGGLSVPSGSSIIISVFLTLASGTISSDASLQLGFASTSGAFTGDDVADIGSNITGSTLRLTHAATTDAAGDIDIILRCDDSVVITATKFQLEDATGRSA